MPDEKLKAQADKMLLVYYYIGKAAEAGLVQGSPNPITVKGFDRALDLIEGGLKLTKEDVLYMLRYGGASGIMTVPEDQREGFAFIILKIQDEGFAKVMEEVNNMKQEEKK